MPMACAAIYPVTGKEMEYMGVLKEPTLTPLWEKDMGNKCGRLFQGIWDMKGMNTCLFIEPKNIPKDCKITYEKLCVSSRRTRIRRNAYE
jgi:hypothetical protein